MCGPTRIAWNRVVRRPAAPRGCASAVRATRSATRLAVDRHVQGADPDRDPLERRDLGHVDDVPDVEPVARDLDPGEPVDREVAERVRRRHAPPEPAGSRPLRPAGARAVSRREPPRASRPRATRSCGLSADGLPRPRRRVVAEAALDHRAVEELRAVLRAEPQREPRVAERLARSWPLRASAHAEHVVAVDRRPLALRLSCECERRLQADAVVDVEERRLEIGAHAVRRRAGGGCRPRSCTARVRRARARSRAAGRRRGRRTAAAGSSRPRGARGSSRAGGRRVRARPGRARRARRRSRGTCAARRGGGRSRRRAARGASSSLPELRLRPRVAAPSRRRRRRGRAASARACAVEIADQLARIRDPGVRRDARLRGVPSCRTRRTPAL